MTNTIQSLLISVGGGVLAATAFALFNRLVPPWCIRRRFYWKIWGAFLRDQFVIVYGTWPPNSPGLGEGSLWPPIVALVTSWRYGSRKHRETIPLLPARVCRSDDLRAKHVIQIGGPASNPLCKEVLEGSPFNYHLEDSGTYSISAGGRKYETKWCRDGRSVHYGLCVLRCSPWNPSKLVLSISGLHSYGSEAVARKLFGKTSLQSTSRYIRPKEELKLGILLESEFRNGIYLRSDVLFSAHQ